MKSLLILAYQLSPSRGSEYSVGWNFVNAISKYYRVVVLYGASGDHMDETGEVERYAAENHTPNVEFIPVRAGAVANGINRLNKAGLHPVFYLAFRLWQKRALRVAEEVLQKQDIDIVHHLGPIGYREPGYLGTLAKPMVWGPIGGTQNRSYKLMSALSFGNRVRFTVKNLVNSFQLRFSPRVRWAFRRADVLIAATTADQANIYRVHGRQTWYMTEGATFRGHLDDSKFSSIDSEIRIVWSGRHDAGKNLGLFMRALTMIPAQERSKLKIDILGTGPETARWKDYVEENGLSGLITWHGQITRDKAVRIMGGAHLHVLTSLMEGNPTVVFEAMSNGVPTMTLDHCGMKDTVCADCGIKIPVDNYDSATKEFSIALKNLIADPAKLRSLADGAIRCAEKFSWDKRIGALNQIYEDAVKHYKDGASRRSEISADSFASGLESTVPNDGR